MSKMIERWIPSVGGWLIGNWVGLIIWGSSIALVDGSGVSIGDFVVTCVLMVIIFLILLVPCLLAGAINPAAGVILFVLLSIGYTFIASAPHIWMSGQVVSAGVLPVYSTSGLVARDMLSMKPYIGGVIGAVLGFAIRMR